MSAAGRDLVILGIHPVVPTAAEFEEALEIQWGDLDGDAKESARADVQEHFDGLYLIEVEMTPPNEAPDWNAITQPRTDLPKACWQVPWDEQSIDEAKGRWVFFLHDVDFDLPLATSFGKKKLPQPTAMPEYLKAIKYDVPG